MTRPMRIAVDARPLAFPHSGIGRYTSSLLSHLADCGPHHHFLLYCDRPSPLSFKPPAHWQVRVGAVERRALSTPFAQAVFPLWAIRDRVDVFWSPRHHLPLLLPPYIRKVVTIHDLVWKRFPETMTSGGNLVESLLMPASLWQADSVIAVSQFTRQEIARLFPTAAAKTSVIYEASSLPAETCLAATASAPLMGDRAYFLFVGSSEPRKNLQRLIAAYQGYLATATESIDLVIAGSYQWGEFDARRFVQNNNLGHRIHIKAALDDATLANLYAHARALVMPSLYEGFGLPLTEAMQCGVPIITSRNSAMSEIAGDAALTVDPLDADSIRHAMLVLTENRQLHERLSRLARDRSGMFDWHEAALQTLRVLCPGSPGNST